MTCLNIKRALIKLRRINICYWCGGTGFLWPIYPFASKAKCTSCADPDSKVRNHFTFKPLPIGERVFE